MLIPDDTADTITLNVTYRVGSRNEGYGESGMAHLLEHMVFKGTPTRGDLKAELTSRGARFNGTTSYDRTNYFESLPASADNLAWAIGLEADRMVHSRVSRADLDSEMTVVRNEFESGENSPFRILLERMNATAYVWHAYGRSVIGSRSDIENVPIDRLQAFYRTYYQPDNATVVIAGHIYPAEALRLAAREFGAIAKPARALPLTYTVEPTQDGERTVTLRRSGDVQIVAATYHAPPGADPGYAAVELLASILSDAPSGRLYRNLVAKGLAADIFGSERQSHDAGSAYFGATVARDASLDAARAALLDTLGSFAGEPVTSAELERARSGVLAAYDKILSDTRTLAVTLSDFIALGDWRTLFWYRERIRAMTAADVQQAALRYLKPDNRTVGLFIPTAAPDRAEIPPVPDLTGQLKDFRGSAELASGESFDPSPGHINERTLRRELPNRMHLAMLPRKTRGARVVVQMALHWGNKASTMDRGAACSAAGAMLMRGSAHHSRAQINDLLDKLSTRMNVSMDALDIDTTRANLPEVLRLAAELLREPAFAEDEFSQLKQQTLSALASRRSDPVNRSGIALSRHLRPYPANDPRYTPTADESEARWRDLKLVDVQRCYQNNLGATDADIAVVGDFDSDALQAQLVDLLGPWHSPVVYERPPAQRFDPGSERSLIETPDKANASWRAGLELHVRDDAADYPALSLVNYMLGGYPGSRLWARVREKEGLSYDVRSILMAGTHDPVGQFLLSAIHAPQNRDRVEQAILEELNHALKDGFSDTEVASARRSLLEFRRLGRTQDAAIAARWLSLLDMKRDFTWDQAIDDKLATVDAAQASAALRKYIAPTTLSMIGAGDFARAAKP